MVICICIITDEPLSTCSEAYAGRQKRCRWNINSEGQEPITCKIIMYVVFCILPPGSTILAKRIGRCLLPVVPGDILYKHFFLRNSLIYNNTCKCRKSTSNSSIPAGPPSLMLLLLAIHSTVCCCYIFISLVCYTLQLKSLFLWGCLQVHKSCSTSLLHLQPPLAKKIWFSSYSLQALTAGVQCAGPAFGVRFRRDINVFRRFAKR